MKKLPRKVIIKDNLEPVIFRMLGCSHARGGDKVFGRAEGFRFSNKKLFASCDKNKSLKVDPSRL